MYIIICLLIIIILIIIFSAYYTTIEGMYSNYTLDNSDISNKYLFDFKLKNILILEFIQISSYDLNMLEVSNILEKVSNVKPGRIENISYDNKKLIASFIINKSENINEPNENQIIKYIKKALKDNNSLLLQNYKIKNFKINLKYINNSNINSNWWSSI